MTETNSSQEYNPHRDLGDTEQELSQKAKEINILRTRLEKAMIEFEGYLNRKEKIKQDIIDPDEKE